jgi:adenosylmethionine-8-amino-7-oxononanoate aminotransferase
MNASEQQKKDASTFGNPLTQHKTYAAAGYFHAQGNYLYDHKGNKYFDAILAGTRSGHVNPALAQALKDQVDQLHHVVLRDARAW